MSEPIAVRWTPRSEPLAPIGLAATGPAAAALGRHLLATPARLAGLHGVAARGLLVVLGPGDALPWYPGVVYLGRDADAPGLLLPTTLSASVHPALLAEALGAAHPATPPPLAVLPGVRVVVSVADACPLQEQRLREWLLEGA